MNFHFCMNAPSNNMSRVVLGFVAAVVVLSVCCVVLVFF